jgi:hypothetical protein
MKAGVWCWLMVVDKGVQLRVIAYPVFAEFEHSIDSAYTMQVRPIFTKFYKYGEFDLMLAMTRDQSLDFSRIYVVPLERREINGGAIHVFQNINPMPEVI